MCKFVFKQCGVCHVMCVSVEGEYHYIDFVCQDCAPPGLLMYNFQMRIDTKVNYL